MAYHPLYYVRRDEDWIPGSTLSATSEQTGYEAAKAKTDDPSEPWWADSVSATLTVGFGASKEVGLIALIMQNGVDTKVITVAGGISGTITSVREKSGYPRDVVLIIDPPVTVSGFTLAIASNTYKWSIGRVVAGKRRSIENLMDGMTTEYFRGKETDAGIEGHMNTINYDVGVDHWKMEGTVLCSAADYVLAQDWYSSTKQGVLPTLVVADATRYPPLWAFMTMGPRRTKERLVEVPLSFVTQGRGQEVV